MIFKPPDQELEIKQNISVHSNKGEIELKNRIKNRIIEEYAKNLKYMDIANVLFVALDSSGNVCLANLKTCELLGYGRSEIIGKNWSESFIPERYGDQAPPLGHNPLTNEIELSKFTEFPLMSKNGEERIILWHHTVIDDDAGKVIGYLSSGEDVTDLRKTEEAIRKSEMEYHSLFENMPNGFAYHKIVTDKNNKPIDYIFLEINSAFEHHTGLTRDIIGMTVTEVFPGIRDNDPDLIAIYGKVALSQEPAKFELYFEPIDRMFSVTAYCPRKGYFVCIIDNISDKRKAEEERILSEELYRGIFDNHLAGNYISKPNGDLITCNNAFLNIFGYSTIEELKSLSMSELYPSPEQRDEFIQLLKKKKKLEFQEKKLLHRDGHKLDVIQNSIAVFDDDGEIIEIRGYLIDNTDRKNLEEQLHHSQKMEGIGRLAGGVAHDFNNLLTIISGYADIALISLDPDHPVRVEISEIKAASNRATELTRQLLAFSRRQALQPKVMNLNEVIRNLDKMLRRIIGEDIEFEINSTNDICNILADPGQIEQVFTNLVVNARDAMPSGGKLSIELSNVTIDEDYAKNFPDANPGDYIETIIRDTGCGMTEEVRAKIFDPFFTTKDAKKGTGLGLSTIYGIVKQSEGFIQVRSEVGEGSEFKIYFPCTDEEIDSEELSSVSSEIPRGNESIILVEDQDGVRNLACLNLKKLGYNVFEAKSGQQALNICHRLDGKIDMVITDVVMPNMSGPELISELRNEFGLDVKALFISGHTHETISQHGVMNYKIPCLRKPFQNFDLAKKIREILDDES